MSNPDLPAELLDHTVDLLRNERDALESCCLVSKSWIPRTRKYLFAVVKLQTPAMLQAWKSTFTNPSTSPACYTKSLSIRYHQRDTPQDAEEGGWIPTFSRVERLEVVINNPMASLIPFHGFSPAIKYLHIDCTCYPSSSIPDLIYSFPLLEDFSVIAFLGNRRQDNFNDKLAATQPSSSPAFTGTLGVFVWEGMHRIASALLSSPNGLHFRKLDLVLRSKQDVLATIALVDECSSTLESLKINYDIPGMPTPCPRSCQWLSYVHRSTSRFN